ncbi:MAG: phosphatidate cytidylyltransferase [candidate division NC10 bacterium]|nr:phosphatidate cytidylyltransferase [candidate division NC10 bacterium]
MHLQRILSAGLLIPPLILLIILGTPFHFFLLMSVALVLGLYEFYAMAQAMGLKVLKILGIVGGLGFHTAVAIRGEGQEAVVLGSFVILTLTVLLFTEDPKAALERAAVTIFGVLYVAGLLSFASLLRVMPEGKSYILYVMLIAWIGDTGALYVGSFFGRRKLSPAISPNKTLEGLLGGIAASLGASLVARGWIVRGLGFAEALGLGFALGLLGQVGDLVESMLKRSMGVKDSGALIPGHGGLLDVIDSLLFACPALYLYLTLAKG